MANTRNNSMYRDPALAKAFDNLASMFAPPGGADMAGYATAAAKKAEMERLSWLYNNSQDPTASSRAAVLGIQGYGQTPVGFGMTDTTNRRGQDVDASTKLRQTEMQQRGETDRTMLAPVAQGATRFVPPALADQYKVAPQQTGVIEMKPGEQTTLPDGRVITGPALKPANMDQWLAGQAQERVNSGQLKLTNEQLLDTVFGKQTPVQAIGPDGKPIFASPGTAVRMGLSPADTSAPDKPDNFLAVGLDGKERRFLGRAGAQGVVDVATGQVVPNVVRREGTSGGMSVEVGKDGTFRLVQGNAAGQTNSRVTDLQRQEAESGRAVNELTSLFNRLTADDVGVAGNLNEALTNWGAQVFPSLARPDVVGTRSQLAATSLGLARTLVQDDRLSDGDRRAAQEVMVSGGLGESIESARPKLASIIVLNAYRQRYANSVRTNGEKLPPLNGAILGKMVDEGVVTPPVAKMYADAVLSRQGGSTGAPPLAQALQGAGVLPGASPAAPPGATASDPLSDARNAIARGAPREAVANRLRQMGIDPGGL